MALITVFGIDRSRRLSSLPLKFRWNDSVQLADVCAMIYDYARTRPEGSTYRSNKSRRSELAK
jgi:hypothetical protein